MKRTFLLKKLPLLLLGSGLVLTVAFAQTKAGNDKKSFDDTIPKKQKNIRDLDEALLELDKGEVEMQKAMREVDGEKIEREVREALKGVDVDMARMKEEIARAMKEVDMQKINAQVQRDLAGAQKDLARVDMEKVKRQIEESLSKVDEQKMKAEMKKVREMDFSKMKKEMEGIRPEIEKSLREAKKNIEKARQEITSYKNLVNALEKDGYLNKAGNYKVEYKSGELVVNGKKVPADAVKKYNEFLSDKKDFTLQKDEDGLDIHNK